MNISIHKLILGCGLLISSLLPSRSHAQAIIPCASDEFRNAALLHFPSLENDRIMAEQRCDSMIKAIHYTRNKISDTIVRVIPVVFHVIYFGQPSGSDNISKKSIEEQMVTLNEAYRKINKDTNQIRPLFKGMQTNMYVQFALATRDPEGNCSYGITRTQSKYSKDATDSIKQVIQWDTKKYLNIWVVRNIDSKALKGSGIILGYAQFPWDAHARPRTDGIVLDYRYCGKGQKTLIHEAGHYLGLYHPFQDACGKGDLVDDTPPALKANFGCRDTNSCTGAVPDLPDMIENYMDYADCKFLFTNGQKERLDIMTYLFRNPQYSESNIAFTLDTKPCTVGIADKNEPLTAFSDEIFPNPSQGEFKLNIRADRSSKITLSLWNAQGQMVAASRTLMVSEGDQSFDIGKELTGNTSGGLYFLRLQTENELMVRQIILSK